MTYIVNSARLRGRRAELGLSQVGLAKIAGVSPNTVTHLEKDPNINVTLAVLSRLCSALNLSITDLVVEANINKGGMEIDSGPFDTKPNV
jgi:DNA-binding XRE family transcriptional regulator